MYYGLIMLSVVMFGGCFVLNDIHRKMRGACLKVSLQSSMVSSLIGLFVLLAINGFRFEFTPYTLIVAALASLNSLTLTYCGFKALGTINLSLYSLFMMLGGMLLPFLQGILFFNEQLTVGKSVCILLIFLALATSAQKGTDKKEGRVYYIAIFVLNGMSGVLSKLFVSAPYPKTSPAGYSILLCAVTSVISAGLLLILFRSKKEDGVPKMTPLTAAISGLSGATNQVANFLLTTALLHIDASVQYPMVTGGVMIVSTLAAFFTKDKPTKKEMAAVGVAFAGLLALFLIPV